MSTLGNFWKSFKKISVGLGYKKSERLSKFAYVSCLGPIKMLHVFLQWNKIENIRILDLCEDAALD